MEVAIDYDSWNPYASTATETTEPVVDKIDLVITIGTEIFNPPVAPVLLFKRDPNLVSVLSNTDTPNQLVLPETP